ncbi:unnamed protein product, partial [Oppiella nova]
VVVNEPNGPDVYKGVPKELSITGDEITPERFLRVLRGDNSSGSLVINSGPNDHIFVYLIDHGSDDIVEFPNGLLYGEELVTTIKDMHANKKFAKLVFYLDTCHAGSMFANLLPNDIDVYVTTSSSPDENSHFCCYDERLKVFVGLSYSNFWIKNTDTFDLTNETLQQQFEYVRDNSYDTVIDGKHEYEHNQQYGDLSIAKLPVSHFLGNEANLLLIAIAERLLRDRYVKELESILKGREFVDNFMTEYVNSIQHLIPNIETNAILNTKRELNNRLCYRQLVDTFHQKCFNLNQYF